MKKKCLDFAKRHAHWNTEIWIRVLFSDESSVNQFSVRKYQVWRPAGARHKEKYTLPTVKHPHSQMVWEVMSSMGTAGLYFLPSGKTINGEKYVNLWKSMLEIHMTDHNCQIFMHDGTPCHRSKVVKKFLEQKQIQTLEWPGNSPDLNPIENLWCVTEKHPTSLSALQLAIKEVWVKEISSDYCCKLIESMPHCLQEVIKNKGGHTKY